MGLGLTALPISLFLSLRLMVRPIETNQGAVNANGFLAKNVQKIWWCQKMVLPLQSQNQNGRMDEWFSHRSAKPGTAVRVRLRPQRSEGGNRLITTLTILLSDVP